MTSSFSVYWWHHFGAVVVVPDGPLDAMSYAKLRDAVVKAATDAPRAVLVELDRLRVGSTSALAVFPAIAEELALWPRIPLLLVAAEDDSHKVLADYRMARFVAVHRSVEDAVAAIGEPPPRQVARVDLPNGDACFRMARTFVRECCERWQVTGERTVDAVLVASELVENTIKHTYGPPALRMEFRRDMLSVAVYDDDPEPPRRPEPPSTATVAHGLTVVDRLSRSWGSSPTPAGGKVVWAVL